jgi:hypothetical protein
LTVAESASPPRAGRAAPKPGYLAAIGLATGLGALAASSCCVLPLALAGLGAGASVFTVLEGLAPLRWPLMAASGLALVGAWFVYARRQRACAADASCAAPSRARSRGYRVRHAVPCDRSGVGCNRADSSPSYAPGHLMQLQSTLTCPACEHRATEAMPTDACQFFYECPGCGTLLRPKAGDCCVFCSYGDVSCPPIQEARAAGVPAGCCGAA